MNKVIHLNIEGMTVGSKLHNLDVIKKLSNRYPEIQLAASGEAVGLVSGESSTLASGFHALGTGSAGKSPSVQANNAIYTEEFAKNPQLEAFVGKIPAPNKIHIIVSLSDRPQTTDLEYLYAILEGLWSHQVLIHLIVGTDGNLSDKLLAEFDARLEPYRNVKIASVTGSFYAYSSQGYWNRTEQFYKLLFNGEANSKSDIKLAIKDHLSEAYVPPTALTHNDQVRDNDGLILIDSVATDMPLLHAMLDESFSGFPVNLPSISLLSVSPSHNSVPAMFNWDSYTTISKVLTERGMLHLKVLTSNRNWMIPLMDGDDKQSMLEKHLIITTNGQSESEIATQINEAIIELTGQDFSYSFINLSGACDVDAANLSGIVSELVEFASVKGFILIITGLSEGSELPVPMIVAGRKLPPLNSVGNLPQAASTILELLGVSPDGRLGMDDSLIVPSFVRSW